MVQDRHLLDIKNSAKLSKDVHRGHEHRWIKDLTLHSAKDNLGSEFGHRTLESALEEQPDLEEGHRLRCEKFAFPFGGQRSGSMSAASRYTLNKEHLTIRDDRRSCPQIKAASHAGVSKLGDDFYV